MIRKDRMLLFDLDGTLWDSAENVAVSWNLVFEKRGVKTRLCGDDIRSVMGKTMKEIASTILPDMEEDRRAELFHECETFEVAYIAEHGGDLFADVRDTLRSLKDRGYIMAIVSNCQTGYIPAFIESMDMAEFFCDYEEWGRTLKVKGENIRLTARRNGFEGADGRINAIYVGDTQKDWDAAEYAGIPFIHAAYGFGRTDAADAVISSFSELPDALENFKQQRC